VGIREHLPQPHEAVPLRQGPRRWGLKASSSPSLCSHPRYSRSFTQ
jgi:hypothetical protein